jgi:hypothetical protein
MTNKTILLGLVAISFVAGSIMTGTMAYANSVDPLIAINAVISDLQTKVTGLLTRMTAGETVNTNQ